MVDGATRPQPPSSRRRARDVAQVLSMKQVCLVMFVLATAGALGRTAPAETVPASLADLFRPGAALQDRNGDGAVDFVDAQLVLPEHPAPAEVAAASNVAARLGYETSAMDIPVARGFGEHAATIFVGAKALASADLPLASIGGSALKPGDGLVTAFSLAGKPAVAILGGDDAGLNAAAVTFAGHLPRIWDRKSPEVDKVAEDLKEFLRGKGIVATSAVTSGVRVHADDSGAAPDTAEQVVVAVQMAGGGDVLKAQVALNQLKATGARDAKRPLSYAHVRAVQIRLRAPGMGLVSVDLPKAATPDPPVQPPARRPGGGAKENFDLSSFYTNDGGLADSDNNLIPDRLDVLLSADGEGSEGVVDLAARLGLESTGISLPIAKTAAALSAPDSEPILVLIGTSHPAVEQLIKDKKFVAPALQPGEGLIQVVKKAFGEKSALIVTGGDAAGVARAMGQLAATFPHIWQRGKDRTTLDDVEEDVRRFIGGRSPSGQAAMALYKLKKLAEQLKDKPLASAHVKVFVEKAADGLADVVKADAGVL